MTLPKNRIELFLWLESDRMQNAVLREFYSERSVVREERRMRTDDRPTGRYYETLNPSSAKRSVPHPGHRLAHGH